MKICRKGFFFFLHSGGLCKDLWIFSQCFVVLRVQIGMYFNLIGSMFISIVFLLFEFLDTSSAYASAAVLILFYSE